MKTEYLSMLGLSEYYPSIPIAIFLNFLLAMWIVRCAEFEAKCNAGWVTREDIKLLSLTCSICLGFISLYLLYVPLGTGDAVFAFRILMQAHAALLVIGFLFGLFKIKRPLTMASSLMLICYFSILTHYYFLPEKIVFPHVDFSAEFTFFYSAFPVFLFDCYIKSR